MSHAMHFSPSMYIYLTTSSFYPGMLMGGIGGGVLGQQVRELMALDQNIDNMSYEEMVSASVPTPSLFISRRQVDNYRIVSIMSLGANLVQCTPALVLIHS